MNTTSIFFNHSFDKKRLKAFIYWVLKTFGEKDALIIVEELKRMGFDNATKAGLSIGLNDLKTPSRKKFLISNAQITMNKTDQEFQGAELTATERSQRIIDTWHRTSEDLRKQVVDYFSTYDQLNSVYMMALSGARGNFSQVRQLIGMRGLMADPQGQIISFPIRSNLREGLTLTEYFISCSGARKGLVDTALRTADTGYLTRRLVDISHHIVVKRVTCYTSRGIALKTLRTSHKILLPLKDRLVGRVLGETIYSKDQIDVLSEQSNQNIIARKNQEISPDLALKISLVKEKVEQSSTLLKPKPRQNILSSAVPRDQVTTQKIQTTENKSTYTKNITSVNTVLVRSPLTCTYTHEVCQLCYGWSMAQGSLVSLGEAVGVIAGQSIGEPGTQLTMRTFHTGGVFSGDLLQEIRAPHSGKIRFPKALQGLLIRTSQGKIAFLIKVSGELLIENDTVDNKLLTETSLSKGRFGKGVANESHLQKQVTKLSLEPSTILFVRQGETVKSHQILAELAITTEEGNQPIKSRQTLFSEIRGRIVQWKSILCRSEASYRNLVRSQIEDLAKDRIQRTKSTGGNLGFSEGKAFTIETKLSTKKRSVFVDNVFSLNKNMVSIKQQNQQPLYKNSLEFAGISRTITNFQKKPSVVEANLRFGKGSTGSHLRQGYIGPELIQNFSRAKFHSIHTSKNTGFKEQSIQDSEEKLNNIDNTTLKKIVLSKKHGLGFVEPPSALKLGLLSVIAARIGASEKTYTKTITYNQRNQNLVDEARCKIEDLAKIRRFAIFRQGTNLLLDQSSNTTNNLRPVSIKQYFSNKNSRNEVQVKQSSALLYKSFALVTPCLTAFKSEPNCQYRSLTSVNSLFTEVRLKSKKAKLCLPFINLETRSACLQHLNTIAEEGDLVNEKYTSV